MPATTGDLLPFEALPSGPDGGMSPDSAAPASWLPASSRLAYCLQLIQNLQSPNSGSPALFKDALSLSDFGQGDQSTQSFQFDSTPPTLANHTAMIGDHDVMPGFIAPESGLISPAEDGSASAAHPASISRALAAKQAYYDLELENTEMGDPGMQPGTDFTVATDGGFQPSTVTGRRSRVFAKSR
jgi:hypothetical protein